MVRQEIPVLDPTDRVSFTCKSRHARCDEKKPVCTNCERLRLECRAFDVITKSAWYAVVESSQGERESVSFNDGHGSDDRVGSAAGNFPTSTWDIFNSRITRASSSSDEFTQTPTSKSSSSSTTSGVTLTAEMTHLLHTYQNQSGVTH